MQVKVIFDKDSLDKNLHTGWGVSFLIDGKILFDAGENGAWLMGNMRTLGVDINKIETAVISHDHWDHTGGLWDILKLNSKMKVYACPNFSREFKKRVKLSGNQLIEADKITELTDNIYTTGEIEGRYLLRYMPEQALVIKTRNGLTIITGCAHPGIIKIIENVKQAIPEKIYLVLGGFHLFDKSNKSIIPIVGKFSKLGIEKVAPTHCTGNPAVKLFKQAYANKSIEVKVGHIIEV